MNRAAFFEAADELSGWVSSLSGTTDVMLGQAEDAARGPGRPRWLGACAVLAIYGPGCPQVSPSGLPLTGRCLLTRGGQPPDNGPFSTAC